jgi:hypothetical protein
MMSVSRPSLRQIVQSWLLVVAACAVGLKAVDRVPALLSGTPHGVRAYATVADAEQAIGARLWLPAFYPDTLAWPPARIDAWPGPPLMVALRVNGRADGRERLVVVQSFGAPAPPAPELLVPARVLNTANVVVVTRSAIVTRVVVPGGDVMHDVTWDRDGRRVTLRYHGPVEELLVIAASLERTSR